MARRKKTDREWRKQKREHGGSIRERDGKIFARIQYIGEDGRRRDKERPAKNRKHAREVIKQMRQELSQGGEAALESHSLTFARLAQAYEQARLIPAVIQDGKKIAGLRSYAPTKRFLVPLLAHFGRKHLRTIKHADIESYKLTRLRTPVRCGTDAKGKPIHRPRKIASVNRELALLRAMFTYAQHNEWIWSSPFKKGSALISMSAEHQRERVLSFSEESRLLAACDARSVSYKRGAHKRGKKTIPAHAITARDDKRAHLRPLLIAALDTGMRRGELLKLKWPDVDFAEGSINVLISNSKTQKRRSVPILTLRLREALLELRNSAPPDHDGLVFGITDTFKKGLASVLNQAKIEDFRFHDCRHTATTRMVDSGIPVPEAMRITGHSQYSTFVRYVNRTPEATRKAVELFSNYQALHTTGKEQIKTESEAIN